MIPLSVIGGFLGAGKTTFLNRLINQADAPRCAILVNDFGDIAVDERLVAQHGGDTITLKNGCVCCSLGNDLGRSLSRVLDGDNPPQRIIVEASGVSNPGRIMDIGRISPELQADGVIVIVDTAALQAQLADRWIAATVTAQLASADLLLLSKLDIAATRVRDEVVARLREKFPDTPVAQDSEHSWQLLAELAPTETGPAFFVEPHFGFTARSVVSERRLDLQRLRRWMQRRDDVYRIKGWARLANDDYGLLQVVGKNLAWETIPASDDDGMRLVVIGRGELPGSGAICDAVCVGD